MEIVVFTSLDGLTSQLEQYDLSVTAVNKLDQVYRLIASEQPPQAVYLDDTRSGIPPSELWRCIEAAQRHTITVLVNFIGIASSTLNDALDAGIPATSERAIEQLAGWVGQQLGASRRIATRRLPVVAIGAAKGGIGKTLVTSVLAETLRRRGLRVLIWDCDIANPGLVPLFRVPTSAPSYLHLIQRGPQAWTIPTIQQFVYKPEATRASEAGWGSIDLLVGSHAVAKADDDVLLPSWQGLYSRVVDLPDYDILLIDTSPDYLKRPYPTHVLQSGGYVVLPAPPGNRERMGVGNMLDHLQTYMPGRMDSCFLLCMEPEKGATFTVKDMLPIFMQRYADVRLLGTLPRSPRLASLADEHDGYRSMLDLGPDSPFSQAAHRIGESLATQLGIVLPRPRHQTGAWARLKGRLRGDHIHVPERAVTLSQLAGVADL